MMLLEFKPENTWVDVNTEDFTITLGPNTAREELYSKIYAYGQKDFIYAVEVELLAWSIKKINGELVDHTACIKNDDGSVETVHTVLRRIVSKWDKSVRDIMFTIIGLQNLSVTGQLPSTGLELKQTLQELKGDN